MGELAGYAGDSVEDECGPWVAWGGGLQHASRASLSARLPAAIRG